ncbi:MAG TPA: tRNA uridine-5-carboxymethylaminomethyl(34) synthesis GTPase MnmE [Nevskiaceae bacterium]|nr:tRNA uridine-5-carboxymethylaminomethyl(34) synthesis GTPase MnmE [Nevskiaceae bacterium]
MQFDDTIAAIATAPGRAAVGVVRLSGPRALSIAQKICGDLPPPRAARVRALRAANGAVIDRGLVLVFPAPHSYTGDDVVELQAHGGPVLLNLLLRSACEFGARLARPGEFSQRAFLNERLDLAQAEAVADLIDAASEQAARAAQRSLAGELSQHVHALTQQLIGLRTYVEGALDFSDEDVDWLGDTAWRERLDRVLRDLDQLLKLCAQGRRLREGMVVALSGQPNVGKSTLLNRLAGSDSAIVTDIAGTTRDVLREHIVIGGMPVTLVDTAGLRHSDDPVEAEGIRRAWSAVADAELTLFMVDDRAGITAADRDLLARMGAGARVLIVRNKCDLSARVAEIFEQDGWTQLRLSATTGDGVDLLRARIEYAAGLDAHGEGVFSARARHLDAMHAARAHLQRAAQHIAAHSSAELAAEELRLAQQALNEITGEFTSDDLLGRIFGSFCIGK